MIEVTSVGKISNLLINIKEPSAGLSNVVVFKTGGLAKTLGVVPTFINAENNIVASSSMVTFQKSKS